MLNRPFDPETRIVSRAEQPPMLERACDLCVVGSGASGISAALEAASSGRKVALVDGLPALGGQAVNSIIGMFCGLFSNGPHGRQLTHGIADDILRDLGAEWRVCITRRGPMTTVAMYDEVALGALGQRRPCVAAGMSPLLGAVLRKVRLARPALDLARHRDALRRPDASRPPASSMPAATPRSPGWRALPAASTGGRPDLRHADDRDRGISTRRRSPARDDIVGARPRARGGVRAWCGTTALPSSFPAAAPRSST